jgi:phosphate starvation-inducible PhoH-like protein
LTSKNPAVTFSLAPADNDRLAVLCGQFNSHLKTIAAHFGVEIANRGPEFSISGEPAAAQSAERALHQLYRATAESSDVTEETVHRALREDPAPEDTGQRIKIRTPKKQVVPRNARQFRYVDSILRHDINFGVGPAGTGKTFLAVACAVQALADDEVNRIVLVRPAVEAGERLGFLPGDIGQKVDPYLRPLYDALYDLLGFEKVARLLDRNIIELAPLAYMRGRTLSDSFVILDEAQNTTVQQMKMFLTRIGFGSCAVVTGDMTQSDLPRGTPSGLNHAVQVLGQVEGISVTRFGPADVVRHPLVQRIIEAYDDSHVEGE